MPKSGKERRTTRWVSLKTLARIRWDSGSASDVLEPVNVSRGGLSFESVRRYGLEEIVWAAGAEDAFPGVATSTRTSTNNF